jgi:competence protein ComEA
MTTKNDTQNASAQNDENGAYNKVDLNTATKMDIAKVPFLTNRRADLILRARHNQPGGKFTSVEQLREVTGIGDGIYNTIKDSFFIPGDKSNDAKASNA